MNEDFDSKIKEAMLPSIEADFWLNQKIIKKSLEDKPMKTKRFKKGAIVVLTAAMVMASSVGVMAAVKYFTASEAVEELTGDEEFAKVFLEKDAVKVNETQSVAGYDITLLGIASGEILRDYQWTTAVEDKTYAVVAISNSDGSNIPDMADNDVGYVDDFYVTPMIEGYAPWQLNAHWLGGGCTYDVINGVLYWLMECDNVEIFADSVIYLGVTEGVGNINKAYNYNDATGKITRNEDYEGINALFTLPIDKSRADKEAVEKYLDECMNQ